MPYYTKKLKEDKYCVYKKSDNSLVGCTTSEEKLKKYLKALHANENKNMKNFKYIKNIAQDNSEATILLYKPIGSFYDEESGDITEGVNGYQFAEELLYIAEFVKTIHVRINSVGGSVMDGWSIISAIMNSKADIITHNDGLAASIAGLIFVSGNKRVAMDYSITMMHNPSGGNETVLKKVKDSLVTILKNNSILSKEELNNLMDRETYLTSVEAKNIGLVDEIVESKNQIKINYKNVNEMAKIFNTLINETDMKKTKNTEEVIQEVVIPVIAEETLVVEETEKVEEVIVDAKASFINSINNSLNTNLENDTEILELVSNQLKELNESKEAYHSLKNEFDKVKEQLDKLAKEAEDAKKAKIDEMVNSLFVSGKISKEEITNVKKLAEIDFETTKNCFDKIGVKKATSITATINSVANGESKSAWTLKDYWKKDPKELERIKNEMPSVYEQLVNDFNNKK